MLQGITMAGFNIIDIFALHKTIFLPILVVARKKLNLNSSSMAECVVEKSCRFSILYRSQCHFSRIHTSRRRRL